MPDLTDYQRGHRDSMLAAAELLERETRAYSESLRPDAVAWRGHADAPNTVRRKSALSLLFNLWRRPQEVGRTVAGELRRLAETLPIDPEVPNG